MNIHSSSRDSHIDRKIRVPTNANAGNMYSMNTQIEKVKVDSNRNSRLNVRASQHLASSRLNSKLLNQSLTDTKVRNSLAEMPNKRSGSNLGSKRYILPAKEQSDYTPDIGNKHRSRRQLSETNIRPKASRRNTGSMSPANQNLLNKSLDFGSYNARRPLPINIRQKVFDEWGAIVKHQDEIDQEIKRLQANKRRERQLKYKEDLDQQHSEFIKRKKGALNEEQKKEEELRNLQIKQQHDRDAKADKDRMHKLEIMKNDALNTILKQQERKKYEENLKKLEIEKHQQMTYDENRLFSRNKKKAKQSKFEKDSLYFKFLNQQQQEKNKRIQDEKIADVKFSQKEKEKLDNEEIERKKFFTKLQDIQNANDAKNKMLTKFMNQDDVFIKNQKEEQAFIRHIELENQKAIQKEENARKNLYEQNMRNHKILNDQLREKENKKIAQKRQEVLIAKKLTEDIHKEEVLKNQRELQNKQLKRSYYNELQKQIKLNNKKKAFSGLMTEHEKKVNERDIQAYQNVDTMNLYALIPGYDSYNKQEDYIDKSMKLSSTGSVNIGAGNSKTNFQQNSSSKTVPSFNSGYNVNRKIATLENTNMNLGELDPDGKMPQIDEKKFIPRVLENMAIAERDNYRASTTTKGYGTLKQKY